ncbi:hypothetical protein CDAR_377441 [Caerostris darwini]|uniref:Uncharacterized protein n=1 Tax=Caerostris darwini TaxID=1538125 RepID=A0AAV4W3G2_9ARAC|nr:hypothetical protein CDAR_377441 [Caerostris darwini]
MMMRKRKKKMSCGRDRPHPRSDEGCSPANICRIVEQMNYGTARDSFTAHHPLVWPPPKAPTVSLHNHFLLFSNGLGGIAGVICSAEKEIAAPATHFHSCRISPHTNGMGFAVLCTHDTDFCNFERILWISQC